MAFGGGEGGADAVRCASQVAAKRPPPMHIASREPHRRDKIWDALEKLCVSRCVRRLVGAKNVAKRIRLNQPIGLLGINIGPNKDTTDRLNDYIECLKT